jgi:hypothetical protein
MTEHVHMENMIIAAKDTSIIWQYYREVEKEWEDIQSPMWDVNTLYRKKPSEITVLYQYAYFNSSDEVLASNRFYPSQEDAETDIGCTAYKLQNTRLVVEKWV